mgnify:CR=1 FL=1
MLFRSTDNFSSYYSAELKRMRKEVLLNHPKIDFVECDISNSDLVNQLFAKTKYKTVIHLAAQAGVRLSLENWGEYSRDNLQAFTNILMNSAKHGINNFIYASSSSVYGNRHKERYAESESFLKPVSFYGASKLANEILATSTSSATGLKTRGLRFFTVYGPWGRPDMVYFRMVASALTREPFNFFGDGTLERDFTYISDVVAMILELENELSTRSEGYADVVNIGGGQPRSINQILEIVEKIAGIEVPYHRFEANKSDVQRTSADFTYLNSLINAYPKVRAEDGLEKFYEWASQFEIRGNLSNWVRSVN